MMNTMTEIIRELSMKKANEVLNETGPELG